MAFFNTKKLKVIPPPIPPTPPYVPPVVPTPDPGSTPDIPRPTFTGDFSIILYYTIDENNKINKVLTMASETFNCSVKEDMSIITPTIVLRTNTDLSVYNYAYIPTLDRYYYIKNCTLLTGGRYQLDLKCDVLMSNATNIKTLTAIIEKTEDKNWINEDYNDGSYVNQSGVKVQIKKFTPPSDYVSTSTKGIFLNNPTHVLITQGYHSVSSEE